MVSRVVDAYREQMQTLSTIAALRERVRQERSNGARIGLVPTMGNLHRGHLSLIDYAREASDYVVVSLFVNPLQFGPGEDFERYPRTLLQDEQQLAAVGANLVFAPSVEEVYQKPLAETTRVELRGLSDILCGAHRPGHFAGVATVVNMLFNMVQPDVAVFGQKDYQQLLIIRRMVEDLHLPIQVLSAPTVREPDGLAMSSRNAYLTESERRTAARLYRSLCHARDRLRAGDRDYSSLEDEGMQALGAAGFRPEYFTARRAQDLSEPAGDEATLVVLAAAWLGRARLIDNVLVHGMD